jgi:succinyl-diaminopimelate desuccinylase
LIVNDNERAIVESVESLQEEMIDFLQRMIRTNSENPPGNYEAISDVIAEAFRSLGAEVEIIDAPESESAQRNLPHPRRNVIGRLSSGKPGPRVMLNGHLDTVPIGNLQAWTVEPLGGEVRDNRIFGRGAVDSKGRIAAYWCAAAALLRAGELPAGELLLVATCDEETGGELGAGWLARTRPDLADFAIVEGYNRPVVRASSGILWLEIEVHGRASHASWPWRGHNAVVDASKVIHELEKLRLDLESQRGDIPGIPHTTMSVGTIEGGSKVNVVPDRCVLTVDFRVMPGVETSAIRGQVDAILEQLSDTDPEFSAEIRVIQEQHPMVTDEDSLLVQTVTRTVEDITGERPAIEGEPGGTDARWFNQVGMSTVNYGPGTPAGGNFHAADENVGIDQLLEAAKVCGVSSLRLLLSGSTDGKNE